MVPKLGSLTATQERGFEFVPQLAPLAGELTVEKCGHGAFHLTPLELSLHSTNLGCFVREIVKVTI